MSASTGSPFKAMVKAAPTKSPEPKTPAAPAAHAREKNIELALSSITKQFGEGSIMRLGSNAKMKVETLSTGSLAIDLALGVGGLPLGRIVEVYGPESSGKTTFCLSVIAECQRKGGLAAFIDVEHALDPKYARVVGVKLDDLLVSQPDGGEDALNIMETLIRSNSIDVIVLDSVAALVTKAELDGQMGDMTMGSQARLMSQAMRRLTAVVSKTQCVCIFTNQIREKIGVMFGCFPYQTSVQLRGGRSEMIGTLVNGQRPAEVISWNPRTKEFAPTKIIRRFKHGRNVTNFNLNDSQIGDLKTAYRTLVFRYPNAAGFNKFSCTPNHTIFTPSGEISAEDLTIGDKILVHHKGVRLSNDLEHLLLGSMLGDGSIKQEGEMAAYFREEHAQEQKAYAKWKEKAFGRLCRTPSDNRHGYGYSTVSLYEFAQVRSKFYSQNRRYKHVTTELLEQLNPLSLAIWYLDDGTNNRPRTGGNSKTIYLHRLTENECRSFEGIFATKFGIICRIKYYPKGASSRISFYGAEADKFEDLIRPYCHRSMAYKLTKHDGIGSALPKLDFSSREVDEAIPCEIFEVREKFIVGKMGVRYNVEVENNANFLLANGAIVHNSPETTSGGRALKFFSSIRIDIRRKDQIKTPDGKVIGNRTKIKVVKNKVAPPFTECEFDIMYNEGISASGSLLDLGIEHKILEKKGAWITYQGELVGQGRDAAKQTIREKPELAEKITKAILEKATVTGGTVVTGESSD
jgi:recombination protein RecA